MADPDPESEALIRKLHRELNGLTRRSRGHDTHPAIAAAKARNALQSKKSYESGDGSEDFSEKAMHSKPSSTEERVSADHPSKHLKRDRDHDGRPTKAPKHGPGHTAAGQDNAKQRAANKAPPAPPPPPPVPLTPIEEAAATASALTSSRVKQASRSPHNTASTGSRLIKCFHAGIRWGVTLTPDSIGRRGDLARALNDSFAGQILSCGRGEMLHVVFLDESGHTMEFPALRSDAPEDAAQWRACVEKAVRVYVMR